MDLGITFENTESGVFNEKMRLVFPNGKNFALYDPDDAGTFEYPSVSDYASITTWLVSLFLYGINGDCEKALATCLFGKKYPDRLEYEVPELDQFDSDMESAQIYNLFVADDCYEGKFESTVLNGKEKITKALDFFDLDDDDRDSVESMMDMIDEHLEEGGLACVEANLESACSSAFSQTVDEIE